jgi:hypothetical protein
MRRVQTRKQELIPANLLVVKAKKERLGTITKIKYQLFMSLASIIRQAHHIAPLSHRWLSGVEARSLGTLIYCCSLSAPSFYSRGSTDTPRIIRDSSDFSSTDTLVGEPLKILSNPWNESLICAP